MSARWKSRLLGLVVAGLFVLGLGLGVPRWLGGGSVTALDARPPVPREAVVLLHGLGRGEGSMEPLEERLEQADFRVTNLDYDSTDTPPEILVDQISAEVQRCCSRAPRLHFVTHSLGGILVRAMLARAQPPNLGRVVMLAPPNQGSEIVDSSEWLRWALGPTGGQLGTDSESLPNRLPPPDYEVGVVAGTKSINPLGSAMLPEGNDGAVAVERTKLQGMRDFITVPYNHTFIMQQEEVATLVIRFLRTGRFRSPVQEGGDSEAGS